MAFDAYNSSVPPAMNSAKFFAGAAPITNQIAVKYGLSISDQQNAGKSKAGPRMAPSPNPDTPFQPLPEPPSGKLAQVKAWLRSIMGQNPQNPIPGTGEDPHAYQSDEELVRRLEAENPEMAKLRALKVTEVLKKNEPIISKAEQDAAANDELRKAGKKVSETPLDARIDKIAASKLLDGYQDSINHLQTEQQADVARARPDQLRALFVANQTELQAHKDWLSKARALLKSEDYDAYTKHLQRRP